jgi:hypothetical protein
MRGFHGIAKLQGAQSLSQALLFVRVKETRQSMTGKTKRRTHPDSVRPKELLWQAPGCRGIRGYHHSDSPDQFGLPIPGVGKGHVAAGRTGAGAEGAGAGAAGFAAAAGAGAGAAGFAAGLAAGAAFFAAGFFAATAFLAAGFFAAGAAFLAAGLVFFSAAISTSLS